MQLVPFRERPLVRASGRRVLRKPLSPERLLRSVGWNPVVSLSGRLLGGAEGLAASVIPPPPRLLNPLVNTNRWYTPELSAAPALPQRHPLLGTCRGSVSLNSFRRRRGLEGGAPGSGPRGFASVCKSSAPVVSSQNPRADFPSDPPARPGQVRWCLQPGGALPASPPPLREEAQDSTSPWSEAGQPCLAVHPEATWGALH